jgi:hypothetical protein
MTHPAQNVSPLPARQAAHPVQGGCHKLYGLDETREPAVIVNPKALPADLIAWARGQVEVLEAFHAAQAEIPEEQPVGTVRSAFATETLLCTIGQVLEAAQNRLKPTA